MKIYNYENLNVSNHWKKGLEEGNHPNNSSCREKDSGLIANWKSDTMG